MIGMSKYEINLNPEWDETGYDFLVDAGYAFENGTVFQQSYEMAHTCYSVNFYPRQQQL